MISGRHKVSPSSFVFARARLPENGELVTGIVKDDCAGGQLAQSCTRVSRMQVGRWPTLIFVPRGFLPETNPRACALILRGPRARVLRGASLCGALRDDAYDLG